MTDEITRRLAEVRIGNGPTPQRESTEDGVPVATDTRVVGMPTNPKERALMRSGKRGSRP